MLILQNCRVLRTPKTGSQWVTSALQRSARHCFDAGGDRGGQGPNGYHCTLRNAQRPELPSIAFVRHPTTWYESYWNHRCRLGWQTETHPFDRACGSNVFGEFIENVLAHRPGHCSNALTHWVGIEESPATFVGHFENLKSDLVAALDIFRESYDLAALSSTPATNCSDYLRHVPDWPAGAKSAIERAEAGIISRFYS